MSKRKGPTKARSWGPWIDTDPVIAGEAVERCCHNTVYAVIVRRLVSDNDQWPDMIWLSIRRIDGKAVHDWRHLQRIKDELVGRTFEGMEMYPADDRLVDTSNQYHLYVVDDPRFRWPWGYGDRLVMTAEEAATVGASQRPFEG